MLLWLSMDILRKAMSVGQDIIRRNSLENFAMRAPQEGQTCWGAAQLSHLEHSQVVPRTEFSTAGAGPR